MKIKKQRNSKQPLQLIRQQPKSQISNQSCSSRDVKPMVADAADLIFIQWYNTLTPDCTGACWSGRPLTPHWPPLTCLCLAGEGGTRPGHTLHSSALVALFFDCGPRERSCFLNHPRESLSPLDAAATETTNCTATAKRMTFLFW